jgi:hypothetical protein
VQYDTVNICVQEEPGDTGADLRHLIHKKKKSIENKRRKKKNFCVDKCGIFSTVRIRPVTDGTAGVGMPTV